MFEFSVQLSNLDFQLFGVLSAPSMYEIQRDISRLDEKIIQMHGIQMQCLSALQAIQEAMTKKKSREEIKPAMTVEAPNLVSNIGRSRF